MLVQTADLKNKFFLKFKLYKFGQWLLLSSNMRAPQAPAGRFSSNRNASLKFSFYIKWTKTNSSKIHM